MPPHPNDRMDWSVFPIVTGDREAEGQIRYTGLVGTGFPISVDSWCLSASHVFDGVAGVCFACFPQDTAFRGYEITDIEHHPRADLVLFRVVGRHMQSIAGWSPGLCHASREFTTMGYPTHLLKDHGRPSGVFGAVLDRPELIIAKGHFRRRLTYRLPGFKGNSFAEMSEWLGEGSSGGPVIDQTTGKLLGLYLGYRTEKVTDERGPAQTVGARGIMLRIDEYVDWAPKVLGYQTLGDLLRLGGKPEE